jgi:hypothetical protein
VDSDGEQIPEIKAPAREEEDNQKMKPIDTGARGHGRGFARDQGWVRARGMRTV